MTGYTLSYTEVCYLVKSLSIQYSVLYKPKWYLNHL